MSTDTINDGEGKRNSIALIGTIIFHALILLFLIWYVIITPIPPFIVKPAPEIEFDFGNNINGTGHVESDKMGENTDKSSTNTSQPAAVNKQSAPVLSNDAENPSIKTPTKTSNKTDKIDTASNEPKQQVSVQLASVLNKFSHSKGQSAGGDGNSGQAGNAGSPNGTNPGEGNGDGGPLKYFLKGRKILTRPSIKSNSQDEGTVVVMIVVDQAGNVIKATPGIQGSNTTSPVLYAKAKEAALSTKFSASPDGTPEQQGKMTIIFSIQ
jgi:protein TonB